VRLPRAVRLGSSDVTSEAEQFGRLFEHHAQVVYRFCARRTADLALAQDLTSATFLEAWRHRQRAPFHAPDRALPWLLGVANNVTRNALRGRRRYETAGDRLPAPAAAPTAEDQALDRISAEVRLRRALDAISDLAEIEQEVVMLVLWEELSYEDAAAALGIPIGTVRSRLSRARSKLQVSLSSNAELALKEAP
jgi:RNA polymerase sigma factor (sigma-70 family)